MTRLVRLRDAALLASATASLIAWSGCEGALAIDTPQSGRPDDRRPPDLRIDSGGVSLLGDDGGSGVPPGLYDAGPGGSCSPACGGRVCGDDGCGGTCGSCAEGQVCTLSTGQCESTAPQSELCPPTGTQGRRTGDVVPDFDFPLDDGSRLSIRDLCARRTVLIYWLAEWCGYCRQWMDQDAIPLVRSLDGEDFQLVILVGEDYRYQAPTADDATRIRSEYGFGPEILVGWEDADQFGTILGTNGPQVKLLMIEGNEIAAPVAPMSDSEILSIARR